VSGCLLIADHPPVAPVGAVGWSPLVPPPA
jgi:hypothetical protein